MRSRRVLNKHYPFAKSGASRLLTRRNHQPGVNRKRMVVVVENEKREGKEGRFIARRFAALQKIAPARIISITALEKRDLVEES